MASDISSDTQSSLLPIRPTPPLPLKVSDKDLARGNGPVPATKSANFTDSRFTRNELAFISYYCQGLSAKSAKEKAGYSQGVNGGDVLYRPKIWQEVQKKLRAQFERLQITTDEVIEGVVKLANSNILDYVDVQPDGSFKLNLNNISREHGDAIQELSYDATGRPRLRLADKIAAKTLLARLKGMLTEKMEVTGKDGGPLTIQALDSIVINTTINQINIGSEARHELPQTIEAIDALTAGDPQPMSAEEPAQLSQ